MSDELNFYVVSIPAVIVLGLSKRGSTDLRSPAMSILSLVISPIKAAAIVLPLPIVQDWVSVSAFGRDSSSRNLLVLIAASTIGIAAASLLVARDADDVVRLAVEPISIVFAFHTVLCGRLGLTVVQKPQVPGGMLRGLLGGFSTIISSAGRPPFRVYVTLQNLRSRVFVGRATMFFAAANLIKLPYDALYALV